MQQSVVNQSQTAETSDIEAARTTLRQWTEAVAVGRVEGILALYAPDAILVPTLSNEIVSDEAGRRRYFEFFLSNGKAECTINSEKIRIDHKRCTVAIAGIYSFLFQRSTGPETVPARFLFTFERTGGDWRISGHHSSRCI